MFPSDTDFDTKVTLENEANPIDDDLPFRLLFLGDWSGRANRSTTAQLSNSKPIEIDRDNFDDVIRKLRVGLDLDFQGNGENVLSIEFTELDDFHPDHIFQRLPLFANLRDIRKKLVNPETFNEAAKEVNSWLVSEPSEQSNNNESENTDSSAAQYSSENLLDSILDDAGEDSRKFATQNTEKTQLSEFIGKIVKPHLIQTDAAEQSKLLLIVDEVAADLMRKILHHPEFQTLESAWRGAYFLVRRTDTDSTLKICLLDISKIELADDLKSSDDLTDSFIFRTIKSGIEGRSFNADPWAVLCGNYTFSLNVEDVAALIRLAKIGEETNTPFVSHIEPEMFEFKAFRHLRDFDEWRLAEDSKENKLWRTLRSLPEAKFLGLAVPRFLARLPYGEQTNPTERFYFEEFFDSKQSENYLWINPSFACALLLAKTYSEYGWDILHNLIVDIDDLPLHTYRENSETKTMPCSEVQMSESNYEQLLEQGLMPFVSFRNTDRIRLGRFQSISMPSSILSGKWS